MARETLSEIFFKVNAIFPRGPLLLRLEGLLIDHGADISYSFDRQAPLVLTNSR